MSNPIESYFRGPHTARRFENQMAVADVMSQLAINRRMNPAEIFDALLCSVCSIVQGATTPDEWADAGEFLADELRRRLTVTGDTGDEHHARRMM